MLPHMAIKHNNISMIHYHCKQREIHTQNHVEASGDWMSKQSEVNKVKRTTHCLVKLIKSWKYSMTIHAYTSYLHV